MNHPHFKKPIAEMKLSLAEEGLPLLATLPGSYNFYVVQETDWGVLVIMSVDGASAASGAPVFGPSCIVQGTSCPTWPAPNSELPVRC